MAFKRVFLTALLHIRRMAARLLTQHSSFVLFIYLFIYVLLTSAIDILQYRQQCRMISAQ